MSISNNAGSISFPSSGTITTSDGAGVFTPLSLFSSGADGFWLDLDPDTWFEDTAQTIPTTFGNPIGAWQDKSGNALHALQSVAASRPTYGRMPFGGVRNRLTYSEDVSNADWTKTNVTAASATNIVETITNASHIVTQISAVTSGEVYTFSVTLNKGTLATAPDVCQLAFGSTLFGLTAYANVNVLTGVVEFVGATATCTTASDPDVPGSYRFTMTATATGSGIVYSAAIVAFCNNNPAAARLPSYIGIVTSDVSVYKLQFERAASATDYQKVVQGYDVTESGVPSVPCPWFDGVNDFLDQTASADALTQNIGWLAVIGGACFTAALTANRTLFHASTGTLATSSRATLRGEATNLLSAQGRRLDADSLEGVTSAQIIFSDAIGTGIYDYAVASISLRKDGALVATDSTFQTAGNTENTPSLAVYVGRVSTSYFGGFIPGLVAVAQYRLSDVQLLQTETYIGDQIGGTGL